MGVYPSAFHIRWRLPDWFRPGEARRQVGALAVDVEPTVFWNGENQDDLFRSWAKVVDWVDGCGHVQWGEARPAANNGSSGRLVETDVLGPLGVPPDSVWFTDALPSFFVKRSHSSTRRGQGDVISDVYEPFAAEVGLPRAQMPPRPSPASLIREALQHESDRLLSELQESQATTVITVGEEARRVIHGLAEDAQGPPTQQLEVGPSYGGIGTVMVGEGRYDWYALTHPGNRSTRWRSAISAWATQVKE